MAGHNETSHLDASGRYTRYTAEQLEVLENAYSECSKPNSSDQLQLVQKFPVLANVDHKQIKIWFQNRRCRDKHRKEATELHSSSKRLTAMNEILVQENDRLQKQLRLLLSKNDYLPQIRDIGTATNGWRGGDMITTPQHSLRDINNPSGLLSIAEDTLMRFLTKATGTAVTWLPIPGMKPGPNSHGVFCVAQRCSGAAARACGFVNMDVTKIAEILKDRACWFQDFRSTKIFTTIPTSNGGIVELMYTQTYAPTTLAQARDFGTLRYTTTLEDGSLVVCERSLSGSWAGPDAGMHMQFVRAEMLPSGFLIHPAKCGGYIVHIVDHINFEARYVPEVLRPLYESSEVLGQRMTFAALRYVRQIDEEATGDVEYAPGVQPAILRTYSHKLSRSFNDAINGLSDDGWSVLGCDDTEEVIAIVKSAKIGTSSSSHQSLGGILCAKTQMLLENLPPAVLVRYLRENRPEWADFGVDSYCAASLKASSYQHPGMRPTRFSSSQTMIPLGHTIEHEQTLEVVRLESLSPRQEDESIPGNIHLLQMCGGMDENSVGAYSELVFSPIDGMLPDDAFLLPSGFRIIPLIAKSEGTQFFSTHMAHRVGLPTISTDAENDTSSYTGQAILTMAFQFPIGDTLQDNLVSMARQYVRSVISSVQRVTLATTPLGLIPGPLSNYSPGAPEAHTLAQWAWQSYCSQVGGDLLRGDLYDEGSVLRNMWLHHEAILCFSLEKRPRFIFANHSALRMLETTLANLQDITVENIIGDSAMNTLRTKFQEILHRGYMYLPSGISASTKRRLASYDQVVAWKVLAGDHVTTHCLAISFVNWCFV